MRPTTSKWGHTARVMFAGEDIPRYLTVFRQFNLCMLGNCGIHTSVFPSAHVAGALSTGLGMLQALPSHRWVGRTLLALAILIAIATVYGRYHYLADATAGCLIGVLAAGLAAPRRRPRPYGETLSMRCQFVDR